jgi:hypothetical protein
MACRPGNLAKTNSNLLPVPTRENGFAEKIQIRQYAIATNSTTDGRCADKYQTWQHTRETNGLSANIAEPAVEISSYTSDGAVRTKAGANRYDNKLGIDNEESRSDKGISRQVRDGLTCGNNNHVSKDMPIRNRDTALAGRPPMHYAAFHYVVEVW